MISKYGFGRGRDLDCRELVLRLAHNSFAKRIYKMASIYGFGRGERPMIVEELVLKFSRDSFHNRG